MAMFEKFKEYITREIPHIALIQPEGHMEPWDLVKYCWYFMELAQKQPKEIADLPYDKNFEKEFDDALVKYAFENDENWDNLSKGAWRVLIERMAQAILVALANEYQGEKLMPMPPFPSEEQTKKASFLFYMHEMKYPFEIENRSDFEFPGDPLSSSFH